MSAPNIITIAVSYPEPQIAAFQIGDAPVATIESTLNLGSRMRFIATATGGAVQTKGDDGLWRTEVEWSR